MKFYHLHACAVELDVELGVGLEVELREDRHEVASDLHHDIVEEVACSSVLDLQEFLEHLQREERLNWGFLHEQAINVVSEGSQSYTDGVELGFDFVFVFGPVEAAIAYVLVELFEGDELVFEVGVDAVQAFQRQPFIKIVEHVVEFGQVRDVALLEEQVYFFRVVHVFPDVLPIDRFFHLQKLYYHLLILYS